MQLLFIGTMCTLYNFDKTRKKKMSLFFTYNTHTHHTSCPPNRDDPIKRKENEKKP